MDERLERLRDDLVALQRHMREDSLRDHKRVNPFLEDLSDWKGKGREWTGRQGAEVTIYDSTTIAGDVTIGDHTWIGGYCQLDGSGGLSIGSYCSIASGCQLLSHDTIEWALSGGQSQTRYQRTEVGDRCFLGTLSVITPGVTIGDACVVAAGAVVTNDVPSYTVVAGVPARQIGRVRFDGESPVIEFSESSASDKDPRAS